MRTLAFFGFLGVVAIGGMSLVLTPNAVASDSESGAPVVLDSVDVGTDVPAGRLNGFGPPEPTTHPGGWGNQVGSFWRVIWFSGDLPFAEVRLNIPRRSVAKTVRIVYLNGISGCLGSPLGDTFDVYVARRSWPQTWRLLGRAVWDSATCGPQGESLREVFFELAGPDSECSENDRDSEIRGLDGGDHGNEIVVRFVSAAGRANEPWAFFGTYGQVAIHSVTLTGATSHHNASPKATATP